MLSPGVDGLARVGAALRRRMLPWLVVVGFLGGLLGIAFVGCVSALGSVVGPGVHPDGVQIVVLTLVGLGVGVAGYRWGSTGGVDLLVDNIHVLGGARERRGLVTVIPSAIVGIAAGGALGPEAPLVETTGTAGTAVAERLGWDRGQVRVLTITGMAAGFSVLFGAPIGAAVFALEILHREGLEYYEALVPSLIGSVCGLVLYEAVSGYDLFSPLWDLPEVGPATAASVLPVVLVSLVGAALAAGFVYLTRLVRLTVRRVPGWVRPGLGGLTIGLLALWSPYALTFGEEQLPSIVSLETTVGALAVAAAAKLVAAAVCAGTGWKGGFIIPLFFVGAAMGQALHILMPGADAALMITCGMVATCVGVTKTPLGSTLVVAGTTGFALTPMLLIAAIVAFVLTRPLSHFGSQRSRDWAPMMIPDDGHNEERDGGDRTD